MLSARVVLRHYLALVSLLCVGTVCTAFLAAPLAPRMIVLSRIRTSPATRIILRAAMSSDATATAGVAENLAAIKARVEAAATAAGRPVPRLVAVSKTKPVEALLEAYEAGQRDFGENYVNEIIEKAPLLPADIRWRFIGHLQSNKVKSVVAVPNLQAIETVDTAKLADKLNTGAEAAGRTTPLEAFIQVDTSGEDTKSGVDAEEAVTLATHILTNCPHLKLKGLMTIGAPGDLTCFDRLVEARRLVATATRLEAESLELSMGMSGDFEEAIAAGSTNVRVGSSIFGERDYSKKA